jgi:hypothetical protein
MILLILIEVSKLTGVSTPLVPSSIDGIQCAGREPANLRRQLGRLFPIFHFRANRYPRIPQKLGSRNKRTPLSHRNPAHIFRLPHPSDFRLDIQLPDRPNLPSSQISYSILYAP